MISNRLTGPGKLSFVAHEDIQVHLHAPNEVPFDTESSLKENIFYGSTKEILIKVTEMVNDVGVQDVSINNRECRFPWEKEGIVYPRLYDDYSHSTCVIECLMRAQISFCNCTHHLMPKKVQDATICDIDGLICLTNNFGMNNMTQP